MKINPETNAPYNTPVNATDRFNIRLTPTEKLGLRKMAVMGKQTMSKAMLSILDFYFENAVPSNFWDDIENYDPAFKEEQSNLSKNQMALQGVEDFLKATNTPKGAIPLPKQTKTLEGLFMRKKRCFSRAA